MAIPKAASEQLTRIQKNIATSYLYFKENIKRYHDFRRYIFKESLSFAQKEALTELGRPVVEVNILAAYLARLQGEFAMHEPSIDVSPAEGEPVNQQVIDFLDGYLRHLMHEADKDSFSYDIYKDILSGGFSVAKIYTDYASSMSFAQQIYIKRVFDPTLCGFDPMARTSHKGDGHWCFEIVPTTEEDFKRQYPDIALDKISYLRDEQGFNWSYKDAQDNKIILIVDYYEKKTKKAKVVKLANGQSMTAKDYEKLQALWVERQILDQIPLIMDTRITELETICCYKLIESQILSYEETDYTYLPLVFFDGDSVDLVQDNSASTYQMTRPYVYHAKGVQDLTNFSVMTLANAMENLITSKLIVKKEALPQEMDYHSAIKNLQRMDTIVVNAFSENNPELAIPDPIREVVNQPLPPEVLATFQATGPLTQSILGSFASNIGKNDNDLSGKAVIESSTVGNAAAMPYVVGYLAGLAQLANIAVDLVPKYLVGERTIPTMKLNGDKEYTKINGKEGVQVDYKEKAIRVNISAGVNFQVQKNQAVEQIIAIMNSSEKLAQFFNTDGLPILAKNLTIYGGDELAELIPAWQQKQAQQEQQAMQMQQEEIKNNPQMIKAQADMMKVQTNAEIDKMKLQLDAQRMVMEQQQQEFDNQIAIAKMANEKILNDSKILEAEAKISQAQIDSAVRLEESQTSLETHALDNATKMAEIHSREHDKAMDRHGAHLAERKLEHEIEHSKKELNNAKVQDKRK